MSKELTLEEIHAELLEQLRDIASVCRRHGIEYNLMCGTLLGSIYPVPEGISEGMRSAF